MYPHLSVGLFWFVLFQLRGLKERIPPLQGATLQLLGQALCGGSPSLCFYLQQWQRSCRKRNHKLIHSSGGIQWGSTGNGKGQSESYCLFTHTAGTLHPCSRNITGSSASIPSCVSSLVWGKCVLENVWHLMILPTEFPVCSGFLKFWTQLNKKLKLTAVTHHICFYECVLVPSPCVFGFCGFICVVFWSCVEFFVCLEKNHQNSTDKQKESN